MKRSTLLTLAALLAFAALLLYSTLSVQAAVLAPTRRGVKGGLWGSAGLGEPQGLPLGRRLAVGRRCGLPTAERPFRPRVGFSPPVGGAPGPAR